MTFASAYFCAAYVEMWNLHWGTCGTTCTAINLMSLLFRLIWQAAVTLTATADASDNVDVEGSPTTWKAYDGSVSHKIRFQTSRDYIQTGMREYTVTHTTSSDDIHYDVTWPAYSITFRVTDLDTAGFTFSPTAALQLIEDMDSQTLSITLISQPRNDVIITLQVSDDPRRQLRMASGGLSASDAITLTFNAANWEAPQPVSISAVDDPEVTTGFQVTICMSASSTDPFYQTLEEQCTAVVISAVEETYASEQVEPDQATQIATGAGTSLAIPPDALTAPTTVAVQELSTVDYIPPVEDQFTMLSRASAMTPHGQIFDMPVEVKINLLFATAEDCQSAQIIKSSDTTSDDWSIVPGIQLYEEEDGSMIAAINVTSFSVYTVAVIASGHLPEWSPNHKLDYVERTTGWVQLDPGLTVTENLFAGAAAYGGLQAARVTVTPHASDIAVQGSEVWTSWCGTDGDAASCTTAYSDDDVCRCYLLTKDGGQPVLFSTVAQSGQLTLMLSVLTSATLGANDATSSLEIPLSSMRLDNSFSTSLWIFPDGEGNIEMAVITLVSLDTAIQVSCGWHPSEERLQLEVASGSSVEQRSGTRASVIGGRWHFVVLGYSVDESGNLTAFCDSDIGSDTVEIRLGNQTEANIERLVFGAALDAGVGAAAGWEAFRGRVDDIMVWRDALLPTMFSGPSGCGAGAGICIVLQPNSASLAAHFLLDETLVDSSGQYEMTGSFIVYTEDVISAALMQQALRSVAYSNEHPNPIDDEGRLTLRLSANIELKEQYAANATTPNPLDIDLQAVPDAPVVDTGNDQRTFEVGPEAFAMQIDPQLSVVDEDSFVNNARVWVDDADAADSLVYPPQGISYDVPTTISYSDDPAYQKLNKKFFGRASAAEYQNVLRSLRFFTEHVGDGNRTFWFQVCDATACSDPQPRILRIAKANLPPEIRHDLAPIFTTEDMPIQMTGSQGLLASDPDSPSLLFTTICEGTLGVVDLANGGNTTTGQLDYTYIPNPDVSGVDVFVVQVSDGLRSSDMAVVSITVTKANDIPIANNYSISVLHGQVTQAPQIDLQGSDPDDADAGGVDPNWGLWYYQVLSTSDPEGLRAVELTTVKGVKPEKASGTKQGTNPITVTVSPAVTASALYVYYQAVDRSSFVSQVATLTINLLEPDGSVPDPPPNATYNTERDQGFVAYMNVTDDPDKVVFGQMDVTDEPVKGWQEFIGYTYDGKQEFKYEPWLYRIGSDELGVSIYQKSLGIRSLTSPLFVEIAHAHVLPMPACSTGAASILQLLRELRRGSPCVDSSLDSAQAENMAISLCNAFYDSMPNAHLQLVNLGECPEVTSEGPTKDLTLNDDNQTADSMPPASPNSQLSAAFSRDEMAETIGTIFQNEQFIRLEDIFHRVVTSLESLKMQTLPSGAEVNACDGLSGLEVLLEQIENIATQIYQLAPGPNPEYHARADEAQRRVDGKHGRGVVCLGETDLWGAMHGLNNTEFSGIILGVLAFSPDSATVPASPALQYWLCGGPGNGAVRQVEELEDGQLVPGAEILENEPLTSPSGFVWFVPEQLGRGSPYANFSFCASSGLNITDGALLSDPMDVSVTISCSPGYIISETDDGACEPCPPGSYNSALGVDQRRCELCPVGTQTLTEAQTECTICPPGTFNSAPGTMCASCPAGMVSTAGASSFDDCSCPVGSFNPTLCASRHTGCPAEYSQSHCQTCDLYGDLAVCDEVDQVLPKPVAGYFLHVDRLMTKPDSLIARCNPAAACLAHTDMQDILDGVCGPKAGKDPNYEGPDCESCAAGYFRSGFNCNKCPDNKWILYVILAVMVVVYLPLLSYVSSLKFPGFGAVNIMITFMQILAMLSNFEWEWPEEVLSWFSFVKSIDLGSLNVDLIALECYVSDYNFLSKFTTTVCAPPFLGGLMMLTAVGNHFCVWMGLDVVMQQKLESLGLRKTKAADGAPDSLATTKTVTALRENKRSLATMSNADLSEESEREKLEKLRRQGTRVTRGRPVLESTKRADEEEDTSNALRRMRDKNESKSFVERKGGLLVNALSAQTRALMEASKEGSIGAIYDKMLNTFVLLMSWAYYTLSNTTLQYFYCTTHDVGEEEPIHVLEAQPSVECQIYKGLNPDEPNRHTNLFPMAMVAVVLYPVGILAFFAFALFRNADLFPKLHVGSSDPGEQARIDILARRYGVLFRRYEPEYFYWELVNIGLRKLPLIAARNVMTNPIEQLVVIMAALMVYMCMLVQSKPYDQSQLDAMDYIASISLVMILLAAFLWQSGMMTGVAGTCLVMMVQMAIALTFIALMSYVLSDTMPFLFVLWKNVKRDLRRRLLRKKQPVQKNNMWKALKRSRDMMGNNSLNKICLGLFEKDFVDTLNAYLLNASIEEQAEITQIITQLAKDEETLKRTKSARPGVADGLVRPDQLQHLYAWIAFSCEEEEDAKQMFEYLEVLWNISGDPWHRLEKSIVEKKVVKPAPIAKICPAKRETYETQIGEGLTAVDFSINANVMPSLILEKDILFQLNNVALYPTSDDYNQERRLLDFELHNVSREFSEV